MRIEEDVIAILEASVRKHGEVALTNKHLLNIVKMAIRRRDERDHLGDLIEARAEVEACGDR